MLLNNSNYTTYPGSYCLSNCIFNYLRLSVQNIKELDILMHCDLNIVFKSTNITRSRIFMAFEQGISHFLEENQIVLSGINENDNREHWIRNKIYCNSFIIGHIGTKYLEYNNLFVNNQNVNTKHYINLIGWDEIKGLYVSDGYIPTYPIRSYDGWLKLDYDDPLNHFIEVICEDTSIIGNNIKDVEKYKIKLADTVRSFLRGGNEGENYYGYSAYEELHRYFEYLRYSGEYIEQKNYYNLVFDIASEGIITSKRLLKQLTSEVFSETYTREFEKLVKKFELFKLLVLKCSIDPTKENLEDIESSLSEIMNFEVKLYQNILMAL
ncbi:hypothetical protein [Paenibacillus sp. DR312]|uniref:hypothetical protein n=2 Tax=Paenibacillus TaxID=44249 RepID=UPI0015E41650|nr:hypothetical protein [Paenibacillus sp. DR312]QZN75720.1 hypothetical protein K5K90_31025 [Paenibacillus sp. DR312]